MAPVAVAAAATAVTMIVIIPVVAVVYVARIRAAIILGFVRTATATGRGCTAG